jgi:hypothetical protein
MIHKQLIQRIAKDGVIQPSRRRVDAFLNGLGGGEARVFTRSDSGFPPLLFLASKWCSREKSQDLKGPIDVLNQTKIDFLRVLIVFH